jgi:segregation and condensation protein A
MVPDPLERVKPDALRAAALRAMAAPPGVVVATDHVAPVRASVREAVESVLRLLPASEPMSFRALVSGAPHRLEVIVRFLAVLELYKQGVVDLLQFTNFGEHTVRRLHDGETALDAASLADWDDPAIPVDADDDRDDRDDREAIDLGIDDDLPEVPEVVLEPAPQGQPA